MKRSLFHHVLDVAEEDGFLVPLRFTGAQLDFYAGLGEIFQNRAAASTGVSLKFTTRQDTVGFRYRSGGFFHRVSGFDVLENGVLTANVPVQSGDGLFQYTKTNPGETSLEIVFPASAAIRVGELDLGEWTPAEEKPDRLFVFYGDSITQSAYHPYPSLSFAAAFSRLRKADYLNRGIGSMRFRADSLDPADPCRPDCVFVQYGLNDLVKFSEDGASYTFLNRHQLGGVFRDAENYFDRLCAVHPGAQIVVITPGWTVREREEEHAQTVRALRDGLSELSGRRGFHRVDGLALFPHMEGFLAEDGVHLNAAGSLHYALSLLEQTKDL